MVLLVLLFLPPVLSSVIIIFSVPDATFSARSSRHDDHSSDHEWKE
jgi:hypothetical protein